MTIHGRRGDEQVSPAWGIAVSAAMGNGIVPRTSPVPVTEEHRRRDPGSRARSSQAEKRVALG